MGSEEEQREALYMYQKTSLEELKKKKKKRKKRIIIGLLLFFSLYIICRLPIVDRFLAITFPKYLRYHDVRLNNHSLYTLVEIYDDSFFFGMINMHNGGNRSFNFSEEKQKISVGEIPYVLDLKSYGCFVPSGKRKVKISCSEQNWRNKHMYENQDTTYTKMQILKYSYVAGKTYRLGRDYLIRDDLIGEDKWKSNRIDDYLVVYDGKYVSDLTSYIQEVSVYTIKINFSYKGSTGTIYVGIANDGESLVSL